MFQTGKPLTLKSSLTANKIVDVEGLLSRPQGELRSILRTRLSTIAAVVSSVAPMLILVKIMIIAALGSRVDDLSERKDVVAKIHQTGDTTAVGFDKEKNQWCYIETSQ